MIVTTDFARKKQPEEKLFLLRTIWKTNSEQIKSQLT